MHAAVIKMSDNGWMNEDLTMEWIATVWNGSVDLEVQNDGIHLNATLLAV